MQKTQDYTKVFIALVVTVMLVFQLYSFYSVEDVVEYPTAQDIASLIVIPTVNVSLDNEKIDGIYVKILEDDAWEDEAEELATDEWSERDFKDLYRAIEDLYGNIDDEDDIEYVREDESTRFSRMDADDKDGFVTQYLKVKYEDDEGDDKKVYVTVETEFDEGDLEDQEFFITD